MKNAVAYYRVSTERQGESGLGLEAQQASVKEFVRFKNYILINEFTEIESGAKKKRPVLIQALEYCKRNKCTLIIAKLNRLGRNVALISALMESKVDFLCVDLPEANRFVIHIMAAVAEYQRDEISSNTKAALQAAKKRGVRLGKNGVNLAKRNKEKSVLFALGLKPVIQKIINEGYKTIEGIKSELNRRKIPCFRENGHWHNSTVHNVLKRINLTETHKDF